MSDQEAKAEEEKNKDAPEESSDSLADLQELEKLKQELMKEKEKAAQELAEGQEPATGPDGRSGPEQSDPFPASDGMAETS